MWHLYISCLLPSGHKWLKDYASSEVFARRTADSDICPSGLQQRECFKCNSTEPHHRSLRAGCLWLQHSAAGTKIRISVITKVISVFSVEGQRWSINELECRPFYQLWFQSLICKLSSMLGKFFKMARNIFCSQCKMKLSSTSGMDPDVNSAAESGFIKVDLKQGIRSRMPQLLELLES